MKKTVSDEINNKLNYAKSIVSVNPDKSMEICKEAYDLAKTNSLILEEGYALIGLSLASRVKSDSSSMIDYSYRALAIFEDKNHITGQIKALNLIGIAYFYSSIYEESLKYFLKASELLELERDEYLLSSVLNNIGEIYRESEIYDEAIKYYDKAVHITVNNYPLSHAAILGNIGNIHFEKNEFDMALEVFIKSHSILMDGDDMVSLGEIENKIGKVYYAVGDFEKAEQYYFKSYKRLEDVSNKYYVIDVLINIAQLYIESRSERTLYFYEKVVEVAEMVGAKKKLCQAYKLISEYYENKEDYKNAIEFYKKHSNVNEEIMSLNIRTKLEILNIEFKNAQSADKFEQINNRLEEEITRQRKEIEKIKQANKVLEKKAHEDELTGISNRRSINIYLNKIIEEISSEEDSIVLFMIDIDNFKKYNDYWGHSEGDICLKKIAECITRIQNSRGDSFGRYGGEEFVYISIALDYDDALALGNLLRTEVEDMGLYYMDGEEKKPVTISVGGVMGIKSDFKSISDIMENADRELYRAKRIGKNMTILKDM
ncbi:diguanylate cyclase [Tissierella sp.]|uniref:diguanylate cyclase n=1 Tax=Tissierella sp. TaxID=41274 RepID=UPI0028666A83|nr:diguanylate cyclase [Tissierella sp.]MDR7857524.1 diguanylate cyclase [Tissierella sp.]